MLMMGISDDMPPLPEGHMEDLQHFTKSPEISTSEEERVVTKDVPHQNVLRSVYDILGVNIIIL